MSHRFISYLIALAYVAPSLLRCDKIACFIIKIHFFVVLRKMASSCASAAESNGSSMTTSTTGPHEPTQMQVKSSSSPPCSDTFSSSYPPHAFFGDNTHILDQELIPSTSRLSRVPFTKPIHSNTTSVAISASQTNSTHTQSGHDVHDFVNSAASLTPSSVSRTFGHLPNLPETPVSSSSQLLTNHVLTHPIRRPRTHNRIFSSKDLAVQYGIPEILPPPPRTTLYQSTQSPITDFQTLRSNYLSMLSKNPSDNTNMTASVAPLPTAVSPEELTAPVIPDGGDDASTSLEAMFGTEPSHYFFTTVAQLSTGSLGLPPDVWDATPALMDDQSPWSPDMMYPHLSTPQDSTLDTPLFDYLDESQMLTGPDYMFPLFPTWDEPREPVSQPKAPELDVSTLITMTPTSPALDSFDPSELSSHRQPSSSSSAKPTAPRRKVAPTGVRKGLTPENLLDESAPTQSRNYVTPSVTSRKEVPAVFARKRARSTAFGDEEDQLDDYVLPPNPTEKDLIEQKRRQNTVAARRSRKRKLEHLQLLETSLEAEKREKEQWRQRALMLASILTGLGQPVPDFSQLIPHES